MLDCVFMMSTFCILSTNCWSPGSCEPASTARGAVNRCSRHCEISEHGLPESNAFCAPSFEEAASSMIVTAPSCVLFWLSSSAGGSLKFSKLAVQLKLNTLLLRSQDCFLICDSLTSNEDASTEAFWRLEPADFFDCTDAY